MRTSEQAHDRLRLVEEINETEREQKKKKKKKNSQFSTPQ